MSCVTCYYNCKVVRDTEIIRDEIWVRDGIIIDPEEVQYKSTAGVDCHGHILSPGLIDLKVNGSFGIDFQSLDDLKSGGLENVAKQLPRYGVTSFCPSIVTNTPEFYAEALKLIQKTDQIPDGAAILGVNLDGPFLNPIMKGAHREDCIVNDLSGGIAKVREVYGINSFKEVAIMTLAPELPGAMSAIKDLSSEGVRVSLGHSRASIEVGMQAVENGATLLSHLFNSMPAFHHRDPGLVGLVTFAEECHKQIKFGLIADGHHVHPAAIRMAYRIAPEGLILLSDAVAPSQLGTGQYRVGDKNVTVDETNVAKITGSDTLFGSVTGLLSDVKVLQTHSDCTLAFALNAASKMPAEALGLAEKIGSLSPGCQADFVLLNPSTTEVEATYIRGKCVYGKFKKRDTPPLFVVTDSQSSKQG